MDEHRMARKVLMAEVTGVRLLHGQTDVWLDEWCEDGLEQRRDNRGGDATRERQEGVESPGEYVHD